MLYLNKQNRQVIIALNSYPTAAYPQTSKVPFKLFQGKMNTSETELTLYQGCQTHFHKGPLYDEMIITLRADMEFADMTSF